MPRLQIDLPESAVEKLDDLMGLCKLSTKKELFNNALTLFRWAVTEKQQGHTIASINEQTQTYRELQMPALNEVEVVRRKASVRATLKAG